MWRIQDGLKTDCFRELITCICPGHARHWIKVKLDTTGCLWQVVLIFKFYQNWLDNYRDVCGWNLTNNINLVIGVYDSLYYWAGINYKLLSMTNVWQNVTVIANTKVDSFYLFILFRMYVYAYKDIITTIQARLSLNGNSVSLAAYACFMYVIKT